MNLDIRAVRMILATCASVVAGAGTFVALTTGTAAADEPGRCVQNVNVREHPATASRIVAVCEADTKVVLGEEREGWVRLDELDGWASAEHVAAAGSDDTGAGGLASLVG